VFYEGDCHVKKPLLSTSVLILAGFLFSALPAAAQNWYGHVGTTFYWDDTKTTLVGAHVVSSCVGSTYNYQDGQVTSNVTHDVKPCNTDGSATFVQIAPFEAFKDVSGSCFASSYLIYWDGNGYTMKFTGYNLIPC
jgi:hypothetical protein